MWKTLALLWLVPVAAGLVMFARVAQGRPALNDDERLWLIGESEQESISPSLWLKFTALSVLFFASGLLQGLIVINLGGWLLAMPFLTGAAAVLVVLFWLR